MTWNFTRTNDDNEPLKDGKYKATIIGTEEYMGKYGRTVAFEWLISEPKEYRNRIRKEKFIFESDDAQDQARGLRRLNIFWSQLTDDKDGSIRDFETIRGVEAIITIKSFLQPGDNGQLVSFVNKRDRVNKIIPPSISMPATKLDLGLNAAKSHDDEVPSW